MNVANLQLEGLMMAVASINNVLVHKGLVPIDDINDASRRAEASVTGDERSYEDMSASNNDAICFPIRLLQLVNNAQRPDVTRYSEVGLGAFLHFAVVDDAGFAISNNRARVLSRTPGTDPRLSRHHPNHHAICRGRSLAGTRRETLKRLLPKLRTNPTTGSRQGARSRRDNTTRPKAGPQTGIAAGRELWNAGAAIPHRSIAATFLNFICQPTAKHPHDRERRSAQQAGCQKQVL